VDFRSVVLRFISGCFFKTNMIFFTIKEPSKNLEMNARGKIDFSVVIPIKGTKEEVKIIPRTLPSYYSINPSEVILAVDDPPEDSRIILLIEKIAEEFDAKKKLES